MERCFRKTEPIESGSPLPGEQGIHVVADAIAEVVADDAYAMVEFPVLKEILPVYSGWFEIQGCCYSSSRCRKEN